MNILSGWNATRCIAVCCLCLLMACHAQRKTSTHPGVGRNDVYTATAYRSIAMPICGDQHNPYAEIPPVHAGDNGKLRKRDTTEFVSEELLGVAEGSLRTAATALLYKDCDGIDFYFADDFQGPEIPASVTLPATDDPFAKINIPIDDFQTLPRAEFLTSFRHYFQSFDSIRDILFKPKGVISADVLLPRLILKIRLQVWGRSGDHMRRDTIWLETVMEGRDGYWKFVSMKPMSYTVQYGSRLYFIERTKEVGIDSVIPETVADQNVLPGITYNVGTGGLAVADYDGDGDMDIYVTRSEENLLYRNDGSGHFEEVAMAAGLNNRGKSNGAVFADLDNDGDQDLVLANATGKKVFWNSQVSTVYWNLGDGHFERIDKDAFPVLSGEVRPVALADYDRDGDLDIFFGRWADPGTTPSSYIDSDNGRTDFLIRNNGDGSFTDVSEQAGFGIRQGWTLAAAWSDYNNDQWPDLYLTTDFGRNMLWRNNGDGSFTEVAEAVGVMDVATGMGATWVDYDNDGDLDLYSTNMSSTAGKRVAAIKQKSLTPSLKAAILKMARGNSLFRNEGNGRFSDVTTEAGCYDASWAWGAEWFDFDNDGDRDVFVPNGFWSAASQRDL